MSITQFTIAIYGLPSRKPQLATRKSYAFTLIELFVVIAIITILAGLLFPTLTKARQQAHKIKCLSNLHEIGLGLKMYVDDNHQTFPPSWISQIDSTVPPGSVGDWNHCNALGGKDPLPAFSGWSPPATKRLLNPYVHAWEVFRCPADRGAEWSWGPLRPTVFDNLGNSYCFNGDLGYNDYYSNLAESPVYNLGAQKESWPPQPSRFIMMHEPAAFPWFRGHVEFIQWHGASNPGKNFTATTIKGVRDKFVAPVLFVDGHGQQCDFTAIIKKDPLRGLEPGPDWMWYKPR